MSTSSGSTTTRGYTDVQDRDVTWHGVNARYSLAETEQLQGLPTREAFLIHSLKALCGGEITAGIDVEATQKPQDGTKPEGGLTTSTGKSEAAETLLCVVVFGSRYKEATEATKQIVRARVCDRIAQLPRNAYIITGGAPGVDTWAENARIAQGRPGEVIEAEWRVDGVYNPRAGFERNGRMLDYPAKLAIGFWDGQSNGSADTIEGAKRRGIEIEVHKIGAFTDPEDIPFGEEKNATAPRKRTKRIFANVWTPRRHRRHKTKKRCLEQQRVWKRWYERQGWKVTSHASGYFAMSPDGERHAIVLHEYDAETRERL